MTSEKMYDDLLYPLLCSEGNILGFFDKIFDFLYRRTDFFKLKTRGSPDVGLEDGEAEKIVRSLFCKYMQQEANLRRDLQQAETNSSISDFIIEEVVTTEEENGPSNPPEQNLSVTSDANPQLKESSKRQEDKSDYKVPVMDPDCYNGAAYENYSWSQTLRDVDIRIKVPSCTTSGKMVSVDIHQSNLTAKVLQNQQWEILREGEFPFKINVEESMWTLVPGEHVHVCLQKIQERWWESALVGEPKIDVKSIDPSIPYEELDRESQVKIEELMYNEHLKRLGKPNIQQTKLQSILKDAWDKEGSPFKGQPFDPSTVNIQNAENFKP